MHLRVRSCEFFVTECATRLPFRFGAATLTGAPLCLARATVETEAGGTHVGHSSDLLAPKWFDKDPSRTPQQNMRDLAVSAQAAAALARTLGPAAAFDLWWKLEERLVEARPAAQRLVHGFGVALVERAVLDAACRAAGVSLFEALRQDLFAFQPGLLDGRLEPFDLAHALPETPGTTVEVRHTVGLADPLDEDDLGAGDRVGDGLPETLEEDIRRYGLTCFKVKLCGDVAADARRLVRVAEVWRRTGLERPRFTLDGNEQFVHLGQVRDLLVRLSGDAGFAGCLDGLLYLEQPLSRAVTFDPDRLTDLPAVREFAPVILDEADHRARAFLDATELGYDGISVKNCKGVFRALLNHAWCRTQQGRDGARLFQTSEDLTNLPVLALQQDLVTLSVLGLTHSERNGHHYFRRLEHLPGAEAEAALAAHPDLYRRAPEGVELRLEDGRLEFASLHRAGYGHDSPVDPGARTPLEEWLGGS